MEEDVSQNFPAVGPSPEPPVPVADASPPKKNFVPLLLTIFLLATLPLALFLVLTQRFELRRRAEEKRIDPQQIKNSVVQSASGLPAWTCDEAIQRLIDIFHCAREQISNCQVQTASAPITTEGGTIGAGDPYFLITFEGGRTTAFQPNCSNVPPPEPPAPPTLSCFEPCNPCYPLRTGVCGEGLTCLLISGRGFRCVNRSCPESENCQCLPTLTPTRPVSTPTPTKQPSATPTPSVILTPTLTPTSTPPPSCKMIKIYDSSGKIIPKEDLTALKPGDKIMIAVSGGGEFDKARVRINSMDWLPENETDKKNANGEFYIEYTIPAGVTKFKIEAELHVTGGGWI